MPTIDGLVAISPATTHQTTTHTHETFKDRQCL